MKTRAAVVYEHDAPVVVETLTLDDPKDNEVLLRMGSQRCMPLRSFGGEWNDLSTPHRSRSAMRAPASWNG